MVFLTKISTFVIFHWKTLWCYHTSHTHTSEWNELLCDVLNIRICKHTMEYLHWDKCWVSNQIITNQSFKSFNEKCIFCIHGFCKSFMFVLYIIHNRPNQIMWRNSKSSISIKKNTNTTDNIGSAHRNGRKKKRA